MSEICTICGGYINIELRPVYKDDGRVLQQLLCSVCETFAGDWKAWRKHKRAEEAEHRHKVKESIRAELKRRQMYDRNVRYLIDGTVYDI